MPGCGSDVFCNPGFDCVLASLTFIGIVGVSVGVLLLVRWLAWWWPM